MKTEHTLDGHLIVRTGLSPRLVGALLVVLAVALPILVFRGPGMRLRVGGPWTIVLFVGCSILLLVGFFLLLSHKVNVFPQGSRVCRCSVRIWPLPPSEQEICFDCVRLVSTPWWGFPLQPVTLCRTDVAADAKGWVVASFARLSSALGFARDLCAHAGVALRTDFPLDDPRVMGRVRRRVLLSVLAAVLLAPAIRCVGWSARSIEAGRRRARFRGFGLAAEGVRRYVVDNQGRYPRSWQDLSLEYHEVAQARRWANLDFTVGCEDMLEDPYRIESALTPKWDMAKYGSEGKEIVHAGRCRVLKAVWKTHGRDLGKAHPEWLPAASHPP